jgi:hypothetical protein
MFVWQDIENRVSGYPIYIIRSVSPLKWLFWSLSLSHFGQAKIGWLTQFSRDSLHLSIGLSTFRSVPSWYPYAKLKDISQRDCISCKGRPNPDIFLGPLLASICDGEIVLSSRKIVPRSSQTPYFPIQHLRCSSTLHDCVSTSMSSNTGGPVGRESAFAHHDCLTASHKNIKKTNDQYYHKLIPTAPKIYKLFSTIGGM